MSTTPGPTTDAEPEAGFRRAPAVLRCWGARGSIPSPGADTAGYGGNTACVELRLGSRRLILDAGSGLRPLGSQMAREGGGVQADIFLTHFHWDHIQGFPFFSPLYAPRTRIRIFAPEQGGRDLRSLFATQMGPIYFPVPFEAVAAEIRFEPLREANTWEENGIRVRAIRVRHPSVTLGYRIDWQGCSVAYLPDNELTGGSYEVGPDWRARLTSFLEDVDLLLHDAMYTDEEYAHRVGWGHSTPHEALELAMEARVRRLLLFHHAPDRPDRELDRMVDGLRSTAKESDHHLSVAAAREGEDIPLTNHEES